MKYIFITLIVCLAPTLTMAQTRGSVTIDKQQVYRYVDPMPHAGYDVNKYFADNMQYPEEAIQNGEKGRVIVDFVVSAEGDITNITVRNSFRYPNIAKEAIRLVESMPTWIPGKKDGKPVNVAYSQPIIFMLPK